MQTFQQADSKDRLQVLLFLLQRLTVEKKNNTSKIWNICTFVNAFWYQARQSAPCSGCDCFFKVSRNRLTRRWKQFSLMFHRKIDLLQKFGAVWFKVIFSYSTCWERTYIFATLLLEKYITPEFHINFTCTSSYRDSLGSRKQQNKKQKLPYQLSLHLSQSIDCTLSAYHMQYHTIQFIY